LFPHFLQYSKNLICTETYLLEVLTFFLGIVSRWKANMGEKVARSDPGDILQHCTATQYAKESSQAEAW